MKNAATLARISWTLLAITVAAGIGATHLFEYTFDPITHQMLTALGQLVPLAGLFAVALVLNGKSDRKTSAADVSQEPSSPVLKDRTQPFPTL